MVFLATGMSTEMGLSDSFQRGNVTRNTGCLKELREADSQQENEASSHIELDSASNPADLGS